MERSAPYRPFDSDSRQAADASDNSDRCPYLGIPAGVDPSLVHPSDANQCLRAGLPIPISTIHQENYCFSSRYESCPVYRAHETRPAGGGLLPLTAVGVASTSPAAAWPAPPAPAAPAVDVAAEPAVAAGLVAGKAATAAKNLGSCSRGKNQLIPISRPTLPRPQRAARSDVWTFARLSSASFCWP